MENKNNGTYDYRYTSRAYSRGFLYAKRRHKESNMSDEMLIILNKEVELQLNYTDFEYGILGYIRRQEQLKESQ